ncbi:peroxiredoxin [Myxococcus sp. MISCRS1]|jgi:peroxiredoxin Q/BCP|uniref:peroxiredoxin n=1 Tax=Myxococcus TaxID=32 RepID=UPI0011425616|nr:MULTISPECIES: peroxiredoxin [Myxococcus]BDT33276.1 peroxiredoxin [Myxococcus sp. MH1]MBZ4397096.1 peroxiredoxin [Myxococcus sp. AS-1-15]MBZ4408179.1 peroxiredoxin [Myxococcus sp. XM-1-1-1]MCK8503374.1 peroxiredoxin [Myxococcus fulvus]MCY0996709.1 peroxiredoxin [Myxococcus sp. MISCRS1]
MLAIGDLAPDFVAIDCHGVPLSLSALRGRRVVLFFFPKAFTLGCTIENRAFRDNHLHLQELGAELVGVSVDTQATQCAFAEKEDIHFSLLGDPDRVISRAYDVLWPVLRVDRRVTFIIGPEGRIEDIIRHEVRVYRHLDDVLAYLESHPMTAAYDSAA